MSRPRERACLQEGLKLDLNRLARRGFVKPGADIGARGITWRHHYWDEIATGIISADMSGQNEGWLRVQLGSLEQSISLVARPRHFGGKQWYFACPKIGQLVSVLWRPPGARWFASRWAWGRQVAYQSQFQDETGRAHLGQQRIKSRLIGSLDRDEWDLPPKPKWMRWKTYQRHEDKFDRYEEILDHGCAEAVAKLTGQKLF